MTTFLPKTNAELRKNVNYLGNICGFMCFCAEISAEKSVEVIKIRINLYQNLIF